MNTKSRLRKLEEARGSLFVALPEYQYGPVDGEEEPQIIGLKIQGQRMKLEASRATNETLTDFLIRVRKDVCTTTNSRQAILLDPWVREL